MSQEPKKPEDRGERGAHNELGYRNVDEGAEHDEAGSQGPGAGEPDPREDDDDAE